MTEELVIREIRIDEAAGNSDSWTMSFDYENLIVRWFVLSRLVIREK